MPSFLFLQKFGGKKMNNMRIFIILIYFFFTCSSKKQEDSYIQKIKSLSIGESFSFESKLVGRSIDSFFKINYSDYEMDIKIYFLCSSIIVLRIVKYQDEYFAVIYTIGKKTINTDNALLKRVEPSVSWKDLVKILEDAKYHLPSTSQVELELNTCCGGNEIIDGMEYYVEFSSLKKKYYYNNPKTFLYNNRNKKLNNTKLVVRFLDTIREFFDIQMCNEFEQKLSYP